MVLSMFFEYRSDILIFAAIACFVRETVYFSGVCMVSFSEVNQKQRHTVRDTGSETVFSESWTKTVSIDSKV